VNTNLSPALRSTVTPANPSDQPNNGATWHLSILQTLSFFFFFLGLLAPFSFLFKKYNLSKLRNLGFSEWHLGLDGHIPHEDIFFLEKQNTILMSILLNDAWLWSQNTQTNTYLKSYFLQQKKSLWDPQRSCIRQPPGCSNQRRVSSSLQQCSISLNHPPTNANYYLYMPRVLLIPND
jgi:hypothetical protein